VPSSQANLVIFPSSELLGVPKDADADQIKKAYRKAALQHHPDKVPEDRREASEAKFKAVKQAYEILKEDQTRALYDAGGMEALKRGMPGDGPDMDDILSQMFGFGFGGAGGGRPGRPDAGPRRGPDDEQEYHVTLEELYKGKTVKFQAQKQIICETCKGSGAKEKVQPQECDFCKGQGKVLARMQVGPGLFTQAVRPCEKCMGAGKILKEKDKCKKCKGKRTVKETKMIEIYIPRGSMQGDRVVVEGEADQIPDAKPGDIVFVLAEDGHEVFTRIGHDLSAEVTVTLAEALCGFSRVLLTHLDGRGIQITREKGRILRPGDVLKVHGEGMPHKKGGGNGDLYLVVKVEFPEDGFLRTDQEYEAIQKLLPKPGPEIQAEEIDDVDYEENADLDDVSVSESYPSKRKQNSNFPTQMGANSSDPRGQAWEDEDEGGGHAQCAPQ
jgi:DnaJ homolog subfamily A member 2